MKSEKLIINGNAFYEIDLECIKKKKDSGKQTGSRTVNTPLRSHPTKGQRK